MRRCAWVVAVLVGSTPIGCAEDIEGATPVLADPTPGVLPANPGVVCRDQLTTEVVVSGEGFSPLPYDLAHTPKTWLPGVTLTRVSALDGGTGDGLTVAWDGQPDGVNADALRWTSQEELAFTVRPSMTLADGGAGPLPEGVFDLTITNANGSAGTSHSAVALVPEPELTAATPNLVCLAQGPRTVVMAGTGFLRLDGRDAVVEIGDLAAPFALTAFSGCVDIPHPGVDAALCTGADMVLATDSVPVGEHGLTVQNPETAACESLDDIRLRVVPPPVIEIVEPPAECTAQGTQDVVIVGTGFLQIDGVLPAVTLDGAPIESVGVEGCQDLPTQHHTVASCTRLTVTLPVEATAAPRKPTLVVTNPDPAGCTSTTSTELVLVPPPAIADIQPPVICDDGNDQVLRLSGEWFFVVDLELPTVTLDGVALLPERVVADACDAVDVPRMSVEGCTVLDVTVNPSEVEGDAASFAVTNPQPVECGFDYAIEIPLVDPPRIDAATPALVCTDDGARAIALSGDHFIKVGAQLSTVLLDGATATVTGMSGCTPAGISTVPEAERCTRIDVSAAQGSLEPGPVTVTVLSPEPVGCGSVGDVLVVPPHLVIDAVEPGGVCSASGDVVVEIQGEGFMVIDGAEPSVTLRGEPYALAAPPSDCTDIAVPGLDVKACHTLSVMVPRDALPEGDIPVAVTNPAPDGCAETATGIFYSTPVPDVQAVTPTQFCSEQGATLRVTGQRFTPTAEVTLVSPEGSAGGAVTWVSATTLDVTFPGGIDPGVYGLTVSNAPGCADSLPLAVEVHPNPLVFFVDPPVVYNGITIEATIYLSGLEENAAQVMILGPNGEQQVLTGTSKPNEPNRISVRLPEGLAPGDWAVRVTSAIGCVGVLDGAFEVTDRLTVTIDAVDPAFAWTGRSTPVTITSESGGFVATPRAYMNPKAAPAGTPATNVRAVLFDSATTLSGVIPAGLQANQEYELIVVNPDGTVGLYEPVTITADPPPVVTGILPASLDAQAGQRATIVGESFSTVSMSAQMTCRQLNGTTVGPLTVTPVPGTFTTTSFDAIFPADLAGAGAACVVTVTDADGSAFRYSAISIKTPAQNLNPIVNAQQTLVTARRALGLAAGRPTTQSRFVYAVGGDTGATSGALDTVESANVSLFGSLGAFSIQRHRLPGPRSFPGVVRVGGFIYAVGGHDGSGAVATVLRAPVLDPLATPEVVDVGVTLLAEDDARPGLGEGLWIYRIAAEFPEDDAIDPGGESLPGEPLVVQLPDVPGLALTLSWDAIPGASGYRVYRTRVADQRVDDVRLLGTTSGATRAFMDAGDVTPIAEESPLPAGSLGRWSLAGTLSIPREAAAVATARDPDGANTWFLYAFGGRSGGAPTASWEYATVSITPAAAPKSRERQSLLTFAPGNGDIGTPRAEVQALAVRDVDVEAGIPEGRTWIYVGPGRTGGGTTDDTVAGLVLADGRLGDHLGNPGLVAPAKQPTDAAGYGFGVANGFLFIFFGANGGPSSGGISGQLCLGLGLGACNPDRMPEIRNWNAGINSTTDISRVWGGSVQESAFFFFAGGSTGSPLTVTNRVGTTIQ